MNDERVWQHTRDLDALEELHATAEATSGLPSADCPLCGGTGIWIHEEPDPETGGVAGWVAEVCPNCDTPPAPSSVEEWTPERLVLAEEACRESERYFSTLSAFCRGLMSYSEWTQYLDGRARRIADWCARHKKVMKVRS